MGSQAGNLSTTRSMLTTHLSCIMSTTLLLLCLLVSFSFLVAAAPQRGLIGPQKFSEEESDMISASPHVSPQFSGVVPPTHLLQMLPGGALRKTAAEDSLSSIPMTLGPTLLSGLVLFFQR